MAEPNGKFFVAVHMTIGKIYFEIKILLVKNVD